MDTTRIDKWLWAARFYKTRGVASAAIKGGKVELNGSKPKPSKVVKVGDQLVVTQPHRTVDITVLEISEKRGSAEMATQLYQINNETLNQSRPTSASGLIGFREKGKGRPTKRDRRKIEQLYDTVE